VKYFYALFDTFHFAHSVREGKWTFPEKIVKITIEAIFNQKLYLSNTKGIEGILRKSSRFSLLCDIKMRIKECLRLTIALLSRFNITP